MTQVIEGNNNQLLVQVNGKQVYRLHFSFLISLMFVYLPEVNLRYCKVSNQDSIDIINKYVSKFGYTVNVL